MYNQHLANTIKILRQSKGLTQKDMAADFSEFIGKPDKFKAVNVSKWELGATPRPNTLQQLAKYFNCSVSYITGNYSEDEDGFLVSPITETKNSDNTINIAFLPMYNGIPVWVEENGKNKPGKFALVNGYSDSLVFSDGSVVSVNDIKGVIKTVPDPFTMSMRNTNGTPLSLKEIGDGEKVWIEPIGMPAEMQSTYRGWYQYSKSFSTFLNKTSMPLSEEMYGKSFVAFKSELK